MRRITAFIALIGLLLAPAGLAQAAPYDFFQDTCRDAPDSAVCKDSRASQTGADNSITGPDGVISKATNILSFIIGIVALIVIILSGLQFILATGDTARIANARDAIVYALIGIGVAVFAQVIVRFVVNRI